MVNGTNKSKRAELDALLVSIIERAYRIYDSGHSYYTGREPSMTVTELRDEVIVNYSRKDLLDYRKGERASSLIRGRLEMMREKGLLGSSRGLNSRGQESRMYEPPNRAGASQ